MRNTCIPPSAEPSVRAIYERIREDEGFPEHTGRCYAMLNRCSRPRPLSARALAICLPRREEARDLLFLMPTKPRLLAEDQSGSIAKMRGRHDQARLAAFEWIHAVLQNKVKRDVLRRELATIGFDILLDHPYKGRLSDRNRALVVLASRCGLTKRTGVVREAVVNSSNSRASERERRLERESPYRSGVEIPSLTRKTVRKLAFL